MCKNNKLIPLKLIIAIIILSFSHSCVNNSLNQDFYLGGEIINPTSNYVNIFYNDLKIDSIELDEKNKFFMKLEDINSGIYRIEHLPENQYIIIEEGDSLWIRVNVDDFKESLSFSGKGSSKNNFLVDLTNLDINENIFLSQAYTQESKTFKRVIDSLIQEKNLLWDLFNKSANPSNFAKEITLATIKYNYYNKLERYALLRGKDWSKDERDNFFKYRDEVNINNDKLFLLEPYITYLMNYFNEKTLDNDKIYLEEKNNTDFNIKKLLIIDSQIENQYIKNKLSRAIAIEEILNFNNYDLHDRFIEYFKYVNTSEKYFNEIINLHEDIRKMYKGNPLPNIQLLNYKGEKVETEIELIGKKTLIYFWSQTQMNNYRRTIRRINELKINYPNFRFIGICIQPYTDMVSQAQNILNLDLYDQFSFNNFEKSSKKWVLTYLNKTIIIDNNINIIDGFSNLFTNDIEEILNNN